MVIFKSPPMFNSPPFASVAIEANELAPVSIISVHTMSAKTKVTPSNEAFREAARRGLATIAPGIHNSLIDSSPKSLNFYELGFVAGTTGSFEIGVPQATEKSVEQGSGRLGAVTLHGIVFAGACRTEGNSTAKTGLETLLTYYHYNKLNSAGFGNRVIMRIGNIIMRGYLRGLTWTTSNAELGLISWTLNYMMEDTYAVQGG